MEGGVRSVLFFPVETFFQTARKAWHCKRRAPNVEPSRFGGHGGENYLRVSLVPASKSLDVAVLTAWRKLGTAVAPARLLARSPARLSACPPVRLPCVLTAL